MTTVEIPEREYSLRQLLTEPYLNPTPEMPELFEDRFEGRDQRQTEIEGRTRLDWDRSWLLWFSPLALILIVILVTSYYYLYKKREQFKFGSLFSIFTFVYKFIIEIFKSLSSILKLKDLVLTLFKRSPSKEFNSINENNEEGLNDKNKKQIGKFEKEFGGDLLSQKLPEDVNKLIKYVYLSMVKILSVKYKKKNSSQTPYEYYQEIQSKLPNIKNEIKYITDLYVKYKYSEDKLRDYLIEGIKQAWYKIFDE